jgi:hypothetical protein
MTIPLLDRVLSALPVDVAVTFSFIGTLDGAVYNPEEEMEPTCGLMLQVTDFVGSPGGAHRGLLRLRCEQRGASPDQQDHNRFDDRGTAAHRRAVD